MVEVLIVLGLLITGYSYYAIFKEHHKRNGLRFDEIYPLVIEYLIVVIISVFILYVGVSAIINGCLNRDEVSEVIQEFVFGIVLISLTIIHFIFWIRTHKIDYEEDKREENDKKTANIAEWIELIAFVLVMIGSIFNIVKYANFVDEVVKMEEIGTSILCICVSVFLLWRLNPLNIFKKANKNGSK